MNFILSEDEMAQYMKKTEHEKIVLAKNNQIARLEDELDLVLKAYQNTHNCSMYAAEQDDDFEYYCDGCPIASPNNKLEPYRSICEHEEFTK